MGKNEIVIIIPAFNEESSLPNILNNLSDFRVVLIDDASTDDTNKIASKFSNVEILKNDSNLGYENSILRGFRHALSSYSDECNQLLTIDADGELPVDQVANFVAASRKYNIVIGNRNSFNRISEIIAGFYSRIIYGIADPFCGMRLLNIETARKFVESNYAYNLGFGMLKFSRSFNIEVGCVPVNVSKRLDRSRFGHGFRANYQLLKAIINDISK